MRCNCLNQMYAVLNFPDFEKQVSFLQVMENIY